LGGREGVGWIVGVGGFGGFGGGRSGGWDECDGFLDDFGPAILEGLEEFLFGETLGLEHELPEIGESGGGLGLDEALGGGGEERGEGGVEVAGGEDVGVEEFADLAAGFLSRDAIAEFLGVEITETGVVGGLGKLAAAAVGEEKDARAAVVLVIGHRSSPERMNLDAVGSPRRKDRGHTFLWVKCGSWVWSCQVKYWLKGARVVGHLAKDGAHLR